MAEDRKGAALDAVMTATLAERDQVRIAADIAMLTHMADPDFDTAGEFYGRARMSQVEWDAAVAASEESGVEIHDPFAEEEEDND